MKVDRRSFLRLVPFAPLLARLFVAGQRFVPYSAATLRANGGRFPWSGWVENAAGQTVAFVTKAGKLVRIYPVLDERPFDWAGKLVGI